MYGLRDSYDLVFSFGDVCACSQALRAAGFQYLSLPLDWSGMRDLVGKMKLLVDDFQTLFSRADMECLGPNPRKRHDTYRNRANGMHFLHDFPIGVPMEKCYDGVVEKYRRRAARLRSLIERSKHVLIVHVCPPTWQPRPDADYLEVLELVQKRYPEVEFDLLATSELEHAAFCGEQVREAAPHLFRVAFHYQGRLPATGDEEILAAAFRQLIAKVPDYRTRQERAQEAAVRRRKKLSRYFAANYYEYFLNMVSYKLLRHLQRRLERKGFQF